jgi:hypothetical protein
LLLYYRYWRLRWYRCLWLHWWLGRYWCLRRLRSLGWHWCLRRLRGLIFLSLRFRRTYWSFKCGRSLNLFGSTWNYWIHLIVVIWNRFNHRLVRLLKFCARRLFIFFICNTSLFRSRCSFRFRHWCWRSFILIRICLFWFFLFLLNFGLRWFSFTTLLRSRCFS